MILFASPATSVAVELIPDVLIPWQPPQNMHLFVVEKSVQKLYLYSLDRQGQFHQVLETPCSTGKSTGRKLQAGDAKTPEGVYFFLHRYLDKELAPIYGPMAFTTDYPDALDRRSGRTGSAIWLHGTNRKLIPRDSNGCIAVGNGDIVHLESYIKMRHTPVIIVDKLSYGPPGFTDGKKILELIANWHKAVETGTYQDYVMCYDAKYVPDISWWKEWYQKRDQMIESGQPLKIIPKVQAMARYKDVVVVLCQSVVKEGERQEKIGQFKLFCSKSGDGRFRIIDEDLLLAPEIDRPKEHPFILALRQFKTMDREEEQIRENLMAWAKAWSSKDIETYGNFYASDFRSNQMDKAGWLKHKQRLNKKYQTISVTVEDVKIRANGDQYIVSFVQHYKSSGHTAVGIKQLVLKREGDQWKIVRETWRSR